MTGSLFAGFGENVKGLSPKCELSSQQRRVELMGSEREHFEKLQS